METTLKGPAGGEWMLCSHRCVCPECQTWTEKAWCYWVGLTCRLAICEDCVGKILKEAA